MPFFSRSSSFSTIKMDRPEEQKDGHWNHTSVSQRLNNWAGGMVGVFLSLLIFGFSRRANRWFRKTSNQNGQALLCLLGWSGLEKIHSSTCRFTGTVPFEGLMDLIPKWRPINYTFVRMFISPLSLIFTSKFFCFLYMSTRQRGLINMQTKE